ncbi:MAG TPA: hypothetical protein VLL95_05735 [Phnomibacter sp.]|nr:hypothetical protein [Phnomibacter sp.]
MINSSISFKIDKQRPTNERQWAILIQHATNNKWQDVKALCIFLSAVSGLYLLFILFTSDKNYISFKVVSLAMIILAWCYLGFKAFVFFHGKRDNERRLQHFLNEITDEQLRYSVLIDDIYVNIITHENSLQMQWSEFTDYGIHNETIYVFNRVTPIHTLYWDRSEMGDFEFDTLLKLLRQKSLKRRF